MKIVPTFYLILCMLMASTSLLQAQTMSAYSRTFNLHLERDEESPEIWLTPTETGEQYVINASDRSGVDTVWFEDEVMPAHQDTLFSQPKTITTNLAFEVKAVDVRGNWVEKTLSVNGRGAIVEHKSMEIKASIYNAAYYALLIGVEDYQDESIPDLYYPLKDLESFHTILTERYTFDKVSILKNPTKEEIEKTLDVLKDSIGENDNLLIFFGGHGHWLEASGTGFWFPADAEKDKHATYVRNSTVRDYIKEINSHHTLLIADACFAGSILNDDSRGTEEEEVTPYNILYSRKSRKAMTSGILQQVPDKSVFMKYLLLRLEENTDQYLPAQTLFSRFNLAVLHNSNQYKGDTPVPQHRAINNTGDEGGDFIFIRRQTASSPSK